MESCVQPKKAPSPILVTLSGIVINVKDWQLEKAPHPILDTLSGIVIDVKDVQPAKASSYINLQEPLT